MNLRMDKRLIRTTLSLMTIVFIISTLTISILYSISKKVIESDINKSTALMTASITNELERQLLNISNATYPLSISQSISSLSKYRSYKPSQQIQLMFSAARDYNMCKEIMSGWIKRLYINYVNEGFIMDGSLISQKYYTEVLINEDDLSKINSYSYEIIYIPTEDGLSLQLVRWVPFGTSGDAYIAAEINIDAITGFLDDAALYDGEFSVMYYNDSIVTFSNKQNMSPESILQLNASMLKQKKNITMDSIKYCASYSSIPNFGWTIIRLIPYNEVYNSSKVLKYALIVLISVTILFGLVSSSIATVLIFKPFQIIYKRFSGNTYRTPHHDIAESLEVLLSKIIKDNQQLRDYADENILYIKEKKLLEILFCTGIDSENMTSQLEKLNISFSFPKFRISVISLTGYSERPDAVNIFKSELIRKSLLTQLQYTNNELIVQMEPFKYFIIHNYKQYSIDCIKKNYCNLYSLLLEQFNMAFQIGISGEKQSITMLNKAFLEANIVQGIVGLDHMEAVSIYDDFGTFPKNPFIYPFTCDEQIQFAIKSCNYMMLDQGLHLFKSYLLKYNISNQLALRQVFLTLFNNISHLVVTGNEDMNGFEDVYQQHFEQITYAKDIDVYMDIIHAFSSYIINIFHSDKKQPKDNLGDEIICYLKTHFSEPLSISSISESLHMSTSSLHRITKEKLGITPAQLLTQLRIEKAAELLRETNMAIPEIISMCGYDTKQSFYRQFKRTHKCNPAPYRERFS